MNLEVLGRYHVDADCVDRNASDVGGGDDVDGLGDGHVEYHADGLVDNDIVHDNGCAWPC